MMAELVSMYERGAITADHLAAESLHRVDPADPGPVLAALPACVMDRVRAYVSAYQRGDMRSNYGVLPTADQIESARRWVDDRAGGEPRARKGPHPAVPHAS